MRIILIVLILFALFCFLPKVAAQSGSNIITISKYVGGHEYLLFVGNGGLAAVHSESCYARSHSK